MAEPFPFAGMNSNFRPGEGTEDRVQSLPGYRSPGGEVISRWKLSDQEKKLVLERGEVWLSQMTFGHPLQPALVSGFPLMQLLDEKGQVAGVYDPDDASIPSSPQYSFDFQTPGN